MFVSHYTSQKLVNTTKKYALQSLLNWITPNYTIFFLNYIITMDFKLNIG